MVYDLGIIKRQKAMASPIAAIGGTITYIGSNTVHTFTSSGVFQPLGKGIPTSPLTVSYLVVGGGGAGGRDNSNSGLGGGGGAGGVLTTTGSFVVTGGTAYTIAIGGGGTAISASATGVGNNGNNSAILLPNQITYSLLLNGSSQYITAPSNAAFGFGTGNFTIEFWTYRTSSARQDWIDLNGGTNRLLIYAPSTFPVYYSTAGVGITSTIPISLYTWNHIAVVRISGTTTLYVNGVSGGTYADTLNFNAQPLTIAHDGAGSTYVSGYMSNIRIVNGVGVYTAAFTPPTSPLTSTQSANVNGNPSAAITTQTSLLTLQNSTIIDNSGNGIVLTAVNSPTTTSTVVPPFGVSAIGGGGGAALNTGAANSGGSGGGGDGTQIPGTGTAGQGNAGGAAFWNGTPSSSAGGGGGAGAAGTAGTINQGGAGGAGILNPVTGLYYAGGGGGSAYSAGNWGVGGAGGGGKGAVNSTSAAVDGTGNTGGGGGGGGNFSTGQSGAGGSGVVIISYPNPSYTASITRQSDPYFKSNVLLLSGSNPPITKCISVDYLVVGGGGAGNYGSGRFYGGGGGGAGGVISSSIIAPSGSSFTITVGGGGSANGGNGLPSSITKVGGGTVTGLGGGGGGASAGAGSAGGSGGGAGGATTQPTSTSGGCGTAGSSAYSGNGQGAAGGGAGAIGFTGGAGGAGRYFPKFQIYGTDATNSTSPTWGKGYYGGGGGAGNWSVMGAPLGGVGGGGQAGPGTGVAGQNYTGGGGGGGQAGNCNQTYNGGNGGNGVVIMRHLCLPGYSAVTIGSPTIITSSSYKYYVFTNSGSIQLNSTSTISSITAIDNKNFLTPAARAFIAPAGTPTQGTFSPFGTNWSNYFDGSSYLTIPTSSTFNIGLGPFTVEGWYYFNVLNIQGQEMFRFSGTNTYNPFMFVWDNGTIYFRSAQSSGDIVTAFASGMTTGVWYHWAVTRIGNVYTIYKNGVLMASATSTAVVSENKSVVIGNALNGYISNFRVVNGTALYTNNFTPATAPLPVVTNTVLLTAAGNNFADKSGTTSTFTVTGTPSVQRFSPFNNLGVYNSTLISGSAYFNGTTDYLTSPSTSFTFNGDFTIDGWFYPTSVTGNHTLWNLGTETTGRFNFTLTGNQLLTNLYGSGSTTYTGTITANAWSHIAMVRSGSTIKVYINGVASVTTETQAGTIGNGVLKVGSDSSGGTLFVGYMANLRLANGTTVYTSTFVPPAAPSSEINSSTVMLNYTNAAIYDSTMQNEVITLGSSSLSSTVTKYNNYSMQFNGATDYLTTPSNPNFGFGTSDFTFECWFYPNAFNQISTVGDTIYVTNVTNGLQVGRRDGTGGTGWGVSANNTAWLLTSTTLPTNNIWNHIAVTRSGTTLNLFLNGTSLGTATNSTNFAAGPVSIGSGFGTASSFVNGYIDDLRVTKGVARYTANFTPPTQALLSR